jgi:ribosomal protein S18 acetylase RimI-like enzyme
VRVDVRPFRDADVAPAAKLLADRHTRQREAEPLLAGLGDARAEVERAWRAQEAGGAVALAGGEVVGYLLGSIRESDAWGRHARVGHAGHASRDPEVVRDLYAVAAGDWVAAGARLHLALVPALGELVDPWLRLGFGHMQAHALRESGAEPRPLPAGLVVRRGEIADLRSAPSLATVIWEHQRQAPALTGLDAPPPDELLGGWEDAVADPASAYFVAELEGAVVGHLLLYPEEPDLATPPGSVYLAVAATLPEARGRGVGVALTDRGLAWARAAGYETVHTDWRVPNLESSRFWPRRGFRETFYRLARRVEIG